MPRARLVLKDTPTTSYPIHGDELIIGRSEECDIRLPDRFVSRRHARLRRTINGYELENLGVNPALVNGTPLKRKVLSHEDVVTLGKTDLIFTLESEGEAAAPLSPEEEAMEAMTVFLTVPPMETHGPRFLVTDPEGKTTVHLLEKDALLLGRSAESDILLNHPTVSRRQGVVRKRNGDWVVRNVSAAASLALNGRPVIEEKLHSGDELTIGAFRVTFLSDRPEDTRPGFQEIQPTVAPERSGSWGVWIVLTVAILGIVAYVAYDRRQKPVKSDRVLESALEEAARADYPQAREALSKILDGDAPTDLQDKAQAMLAQRTIAEAKRLEEAGSGREAKTLLAAYVSQYGAAGVGRAVQALLDEHRFKGGQKEEAAGDFLAALQEFSAITIESPLYGEAQKSVSRIWQSYQQKNVPPLPTAQLLEEAEVHFAAKRYTTPLGQNAYALYKSVLAIDPVNAQAIQRIEEMKAFYRETGNRFLQQKNCLAALPYLERFLVIDPQAQDIRDKVNQCNRGVQARKPRPPAGSTATPSHASPPQDRVRTLFEDPAAGETAR